MSNKVTHKDVINYLNMLQLKVNSDSRVKGNVLKETFTREEANDMTTLGVILTSISQSTPLIEQGLNFLAENNYLKE